MDETSGSSSSVDLGAWGLARLGHAIDVSVDRVIRDPQQIYDPSQAYGMDANGNLYTMGQNNSQMYRPQAPANPQTVLMLGIAVILFVVLAK
jgi:hypothetical protein